MTVPRWVRKHLFDYQNIDNLSDEFFKETSSKLRRFRSDEPLVSILIPAYNEEKNIARTLSSFSEIKTNLPTELIVINNKSTDKTQELLDRCGVKTIFEPKQGISFARQAGLEAAKGVYHLCADSDSIYPPGWIDAHVNNLKDPSVSCSYGKYSLIPPKGNIRIMLSIYEFITSLHFKLRKKNKEFLNVLGFNFGFRTADGKSVGGFNTSRPRWSDGWMAMTLMEKGKIKLVKSKDAVVWTDARRLMADGSLWKAFISRVKKESKFLSQYLFPKKKNI